MAKFTDIPAEVRLLILEHYFTGKTIEYRKRNSDEIKHPDILFVSKNFITTSEMRHIILKYAIIHVQDIRTLESMKNYLNLTAVEKSITKVLKIGDGRGITSVSSDWIKARITRILGKVKLIIAVETYIFKLLGREGSTSKQYFQALESCFNGAAELEISGLRYSGHDRASCKKTMEDVVKKLCNDTNHYTATGPAPTGLGQLLKGATLNEMEVELHVGLIFGNLIMRETVCLVS